VQDAVASANLLAEKLRAHAVTTEDLAAVQRRREMPVRRIQAGQVFVHRRMFGPNGEPFPLSWPLRTLLAVALPLLRRLAARIVGIGFRAEHVRTPDAFV